MAKLSVFNHVTLDGYFTDPKGDMSFAHRKEPDPEWDDFVASNVSGEGTLVFGRITYEMMASFWPTPMAAQSMPLVAKRMNSAPKLVFSRTLDQASWSNTRLVATDPAAEIRKRKKESRDDMVILGSGSIVSQLSQERLIDHYHVVVNPVVLGRGRTMFDGVSGPLPLKLVASRRFSNGNVLNQYDLK